MSKFKSGDYVVPSSQIVTYDVKMKNYLGRVLQVTTVHEKEYYGSVQAGIPGEEAFGWNPHDLRFATAEEIEETTKPKSPKPLRRGDLVEYDGDICVVFSEGADLRGEYWIAALTGEPNYYWSKIDKLTQISSIRKKIKRLKHEKKHE